MKMRRSSVLSSVIFLFITIVTVKCECRYEYLLPRNVAPTFYDLHFTIDLDNLTFAGTETIHLYVNKSTSSIKVHALDLVIDDEVQVIQETNVIPVTSTHYADHTQMFTINLAQDLSTHEYYELKLSFRGEIKDELKGIYRSSFYENNVVKYMYTTLSAAAYARKIFPCFDEPSFKAKFRVAITDKNNLVTLANTKIVDVETFEMENGETWKTTNFEVTPVMSTYLLAFAGADYTNTTLFEPKEFSVYSSRTALPTMNYALNVGSDALQKIQDYVGHSYPLEKMDFIAIDDFMFGAMENWGLISFKTSRLSHPDGKLNRRQIHRVVSIISHELVHMFFGNQVTCYNWDYVWLNEGFATYLENIISDKILPNWRIMEYFVVNRMHTVMLEDIQPKTHPMTRQVLTPDEISKIYDFVAYPKAASVIRMIEHIMTPEVFRKSLNLYIQERSFQSATDEQLYEIMEETMRENNECEMTYPPIPDIFRSWAKNAGYPILNVELFYENQTAKLSQELFEPSIGVRTPSYFYILYNYVAASSSDIENGFEKTTAKNWIYLGNEFFHTIQDLMAGRWDGHWVVFNIQQTGYYRVNYDTRNWMALTDELNGVNFTRIHELNRAQLLDDSFNLARSDYLSFEIALNILKYLKHETSLAPLVAGLKSIDFLLSFLDQQDFFEDLHDVLLSIVDEIYVTTNNPPATITTEDEDYHVLTKLHVNMFACKIGAESCVRDTTKKTFLFDFEMYELDVDERPYLYCGMMKDEIAAFQWSQLKLKILQTNGRQQFYRENLEEINEIFEAFTLCDTNLDRIETLLNDVFNYSNTTISYENISNENALQVVENLIRSSSEKRNLMMKFYLENFDAVNEKVAFSETLSIFAQTINTVEHFESFQSLFARAGIQSSPEIYAAIDENIKWISRFSQEISEWVANEKGSAMKTGVSFLSVITFVFVMALQ
ncbi:CLUMA_CG020517, isoform A [Clunio marinus]|uniref:Aminopeptidase n=1 Tax=Clunio marinus TaxID=568069 RepID=A0A1J1J573_9DIPT|nr:CLUMA_CG020517, isoform A [Clunio marinus]